MCLIFRIGNTDNKIAQNQFSFFYLVKLQVLASVAIATGSSCVRQPRYDNGLTYFFPLSFSGKNVGWRMEFNWKSSPVG